MAAVNITPEEGKGGEGAPKAKTVVLHHPLCLEHHSCPPIKRSGADPPPENVKRLEVIYNEVWCGCGVAWCGVVWVGVGVVWCGVRGGCFYGGSATYMRVLALTTRRINHAKRSTNQPCKPIKRPPWT